MGVDALPTTPGSAAPTGNLTGCGVDAKASGVPGRKLVGPATFANEDPPRLPCGRVTGVPATDQNQKVCVGGGRWMGQPPVSVSVSVSVSVGTSRIEVTSHGNLM